MFSFLAVPSTLIVVIHTLTDFPGGSVGKASAYNVGDLGSIPGLERSPGEGKGYLFSPEESPWTGYSPWSHKESDMIESD